MESPQPWKIFPSGTPVAAYASMVAAVVGTTISPCLFFWQALQEVQDNDRWCAEGRAQSIGPSP